MTSSPFVFHTPTEYARTHPDLAAALSEALDEHTDAPTKARMLTGLAARTDLKAAHLRAIVKNIGRDQFTLLTTLLNNPILARSPKVHATVRDHISADAIPTLLHDLHDPADYLPQMLRAADRHSMFPDIHARLRAAFTADQIAAVLDPMVDSYLTALTDGTAHGYDTLPDLSFLTTAQVDRLVAAVTGFLTALDPADPFGPDCGTYESALSRLLSRPDLTLAQADALMDGVIVLARIEEATVNRWREETGDEHVRWGYGFRISRMLNQTTLPEPVLVRALLCPPVREALLADKNTQIGITGEAVIEAVRQGAPVSLLDHYYLHDLPAEVLALCTDRLRTDPATATEDGLDVLFALARTAVHAIGTPAWDDLYALWCEVVPDTGEGCHQDQFAQLVNRRAINWADDSTVPVLQRFAAWASASPDPLLRRHAVAHVYTEPQMVAVTHDPDWEVRFEVLAHPEITEHVMDLLTADPDIRVRLAVARHEKATSATLARLHADPDAQVRLAVANHEQVHVESLRAMADDPDKYVRFAVAEKFLASLA